MKHRLHLSNTRIPNLAWYGPPSHSHQLRLWKLRIQFSLGRGRHQCHLVLSAWNFCPLIVSMSFIGLRMRNLIGFLPRPHIEIKLIDYQKYITDNMTEMIFLSVFIIKTNYVKVLFFLLCWPVNLVTEFILLELTALKKDISYTPKKFMGKGQGLPCWAQNLIQLFFIP